MVESVLVGEICELLTGELWPVLRTDERWDSKSGKYVAEVVDGAIADQLFHVTHLFPPGELIHHQQVSTVAELEQVGGHLLSTGSGRAGVR